MKKIAIIALTALTLSACAQQTFTINPGAASLSKEQMDMFFVGGIGQTKTTNAAAICGGASRVAKVESQLDPIDWLIGSLSSGIVTPRKSRVYCLRR